MSVRIEKWKGVHPEPYLSFSCGSLEEDAALTMSDSDRTFLSMFLASLSTTTQRSLLALDLVTAQRMADGRTNVIVEVRRRCISQSSSFGQTTDRISHVSQIRNAVR